MTDGRGVHTALATQRAEDSSESHEEEPVVSRAVGNNTAACTRSEATVCHRPWAGSAAAHVPRPGGGAGAAHGVTGGLPGVRVAGVGWIRGFVARCRGPHGGNRRVRLAVPHAA